MFPAGQGPSSLQDRGNPSHHRVEAWPTPTSCSAPWPGRWRPPRRSWPRPAAHPAPKHGARRWWCHLVCTRQSAAEPGAAPSAEAPWLSPGERCWGDLGGSGAGSLSAAHPPSHPVSTQVWPPHHADPPLLHNPRAVQQGLTSRVWAAMRWARPLGMPILTAPSAKASEKAHTCSSGEGMGVKASPPWDSAPSLEKAGNLQNKAQGTSHQSQGRSSEVCQGAGLKGPGRH